MGRYRHWLTVDIELGLKEDPEYWDERELEEGIGFTGKYEKYNDGKEFRTEEAAIKFAERLAKDCAAGKVELEPSDDGTHEYIKQINVLELIMDDYKNDLETNHIKSFSIDYENNIYKEVDVED